MSYTVVKTITVVNNHLYESTDITKPLSDFTNSESYVVVKHFTNLYSLSLGRILNFVPHLNLNQPISTALNSLFNDTFISTYIADYIPIKRISDLYSKRLNVFNPIAYKDFKVQFTSINTPTILDDVTQKGFLDDLVISTESSYDFTHCLVAVNGVFHKTTYLNNKLYVLDGFRTIRLSGKRDVVIVDTREIGGHTIIPLTTSNVTQSVYQQPSLVTLSSSILGKTIFPVIDGYFYHRSYNVLSFPDQTHLKIETNKLPLIQQFRHNPRTIYRIDRYGTDAPQSSRKYTDVYEEIFLNQETIPTVSLANADFQYSRLTHYHSFLIVMNNPNLYTVSIDVIPTGTPQFYQESSTRSVSGMMNYGCGLCPSYLIWKDPFKRKSIFINSQDSDIDWQNQTINPLFIPNLIPTPELSAQIPARFIDYVIS